jgi:hypothetical protein
MLRLSSFLIALISTPLIAATIIPFEREAPRVDRYNHISSDNRTSLNYLTRYGVDEGMLRYWRGFSLTNRGPNEIVTPTPESMNFAFRDYFFTSDDHSQRETYLWITDYNGSGRNSDYFETILFFLPRKNQMHVEELNNELIVTLGTGEEVIFSSKSKTLLSGVLKEGPVDLNPKRSERKHAQVQYFGKGLIIRSDSKGSDPRLTPSLQVLKKGETPCKISSETFWTQEGHPKFKFVSDHEALKIIEEKCGSAFTAL